MLKALRSVVSRFGKVTLGRLDKNPFDPVRMDRVLDEAKIYIEKKGFDVVHVDVVHPYLVTPGKGVICFYLGVGKSKESRHSSEGTDLQRLADVFVELVDISKRHLVAIKVGSSSLNRGAIALEISFN